MSDTEEVIVEAVVLVTIQNSERWNGRTVRTNPLVRPFRQWLLDNEIYSISGTQSGGPHFFSGVFPAKHKEAIDAYFDALEDAGGPDVPNAG